MLDFWQFEMLFFWQWVFGGDFIAFWMRVGRWGAVYPVPPLMDSKLFCFLSGLFVSTGFPAFGLYNLVAVSVDIDEAAGAIELTWDLNEADASEVRLLRREQGQTGSESWTTLATFPRAVTAWMDSNVVAGTIYEYGLYLPAEEEVEATAIYLNARYQVPLQDERVIVLLVVDEALASSLAKDIQRFEMDLVGDGWTVERLDFARKGTGDAAGLRAAIQSREAGNPFTSIILLGNLPVVESGAIRPDEHERYWQATDLFYADLDGVWEDTLARWGAVFSRRRSLRPCPRARSERRDRSGDWAY